MKLFLKKKLLLISLITSLLASPITRAQDFELDFLNGGVDDGITLLESYVTPWANAFGAAFNGGWYNTAKPHKLLGFDLTLMVNVGLVPSEYRTFDVQELSLQSLTLADPGAGTMAQTIAGKRETGPAMELVQNVPGYGDQTITSFNMPEGTGLTFIPLPMAQLGLGLPLGTDVTVRYLPNTPIRDVTIGMWGVGLKHSVMQYIPGDKLLPFDVSLFGAYSNLSVDLPVSLQPGSGGIPQAYDSYAPVDFAEQEMALDISAFNVSLIASTTLPVINIFGGVGYSKTLSTIEMAGNYPLPTPNLGGTGYDPATYPSLYQDDGVKTIPSLEFENLSGLAANVGLRLKLGVITFHGAYTKANYNVVSGGIGISFR